MSEFDFLLDRMRREYERMICEAFRVPESFFDSPLDDWVTNATAQAPGPNTEPGDEPPFIIDGVDYEDVTEVEQTKRSSDHLLARPSANKPK